MRNTNKRLLDAYQRMSDFFGPCHWWPAESPWEVMVGAILTQNTAWSNVEKAISRLKSQNCLAPQSLIDSQEEILWEIIRASGYFRQKSKKLKTLAQYFQGRYSGSIEIMRRADLRDLRQELLGVHGIGPETADSILLYALEKPIFVVDAYTRRIFSRHKFFPAKNSYESIQAYFMERLPADVPLYNEYHALIVFTGKHFCRTQPRCEGCPLNGFQKQSP